MTKLEKAEIKGRTDAMIWVTKLVEKWRKQHKESQEWISNHATEYVSKDTYALVDVYEDMADELEKHIDEFANT